MTKTAKEAWRRWLLRFVGSALFLGTVFWLLPTEAIVAAFARLSPGLFLGVAALFLLSHVLAAAKWRLLLGRTMPFRAALGAHMAGLAANLCLPGVAGGDAVRASLAQVQMRDAARVAAGTAADRLIDLIALALLSSAGLFLAGDAGLGGAALRAVALILFATAVALLFFPQLLPRIWDLAPKLPARRLVVRLSAAFDELGRRPMLLGGALGLSVAIQGVLILLAFWLAVGIGVHPALGAWAFAWPLAKIIAALPISLGGLGAREAALATLLAPFGLAAPDVVAAGLVWQAVLLTGGIAGGLVYAFIAGGVRLGVPVGERE